MNKSIIDPMVQGKKSRAVMLTDEEHKAGVNRIFIADLELKREACEQKIKQAIEDRDQIIAKIEEFKQRGC